MNILAALFLGTNLYIVQNVASLTIRVYSDQQLIMQAPMVVGKKEPGDEGENYKTFLGSYTIKHWEKFYVDQKKEYLAWNELKLPPKGSPRSTWGKQGAFGVYAAIMDGPRTGFQHLHGTIGYPSEKNKFVSPITTKSGIIKRIGSKGCSRVSNQTIMLLRNFIPVGTPVFKIYAKEKGTTPIPIKYESWNYVLYAGNDLETLYPLNQEQISELNPKLIIEKGTMTFQASPSVISVADPDNRGKDLATNPYDIPLSEMVYFDVTTGQLEANYKNPKGVPNGGNSFPDYFFIPGTTPTIEAQQKKELIEIKD